jgi:hypothetical protein
VSTVQKNRATSCGSAGVDRVDPIVGAIIKDYLKALLALAASAAVTAAVTAIVLAILKFDLAGALNRWIG